MGAYESGAQPAPPSCAGDCNGDGTVSIGELVILVNIALGNLQSSACPAGIPAGTSVDVGFIIRAVNYALSTCDVQNP